TFEAWLRQRRQSAAAIERLWNLIALPTLNVPAGEGSLALAAKVFRTGLLDARDAGDLGYADVPLSEVHVEPARRALERAGGTVVLRSAVRAVESGPDGTQRPAVRVYGERLEADAVVVAVPHAEAASILPPLPLTA